MRWARDIQFWLGNETVDTVPRCTLMGQKKKIVIDLGYVYQQPLLLISYRPILKYVKFNFYFIIISCITVSHYINTYSHVL